MTKPRLHATGLRARHGLQLAVVVACLAWGGHQLSRDVLARTAPASLQLQSSQDDLANQYPDLPPPVARAVAGVVATQRTLDAGQALAASGVWLDSGHVLTAGHTITASGQLMCGQMSVLAAGQLTPAAASNDPVTHAALRYGKSVDLALLLVRASSNLMQAPPLVPAQRQPEPGDTVYFINYQPAADGTLRSPLAPAGPNPAKDYSKPAVFAGIVMGQASDGVAVAVGGSKSYGLGVADALVRKGASGGAVVNTAGQLVGVSVSSQSLTANRPAASLVQQYRLGLPPGSYQVAHMQAVSQANIDSLQQRLVSCGG